MQEELCNDKKEAYDTSVKNHVEENKLIEGGYTIDENTNYTEVRDHLENINEKYETYSKINGKGDSKNVYQGWCSGVDSIR